MPDWRTSSKFAHVEGGGWTMWRVVIENNGSNSGDKTVLQLVLGKQDNRQKKIKTRKVGKRNVTMPPLVLLISMSTQISLQMADSRDSHGRGELESLAKALNKQSDKLAFLFYVSTIVICAHLIIARMRMHFLFFTLLMLVTCLSLRRGRCRRKQPPRPQARWTRQCGRCVSR